MNELERLSAAVAERYHLGRELGRGGMATVYLARDLKHDRPVALKILKPELAASLGSQRFLREVKITARLNHPHVLPLLDSGEAEGFLYFVMPYVEGESLRDRLNREKQLPLEDALKITRQVADALSYAHSHDVVHRDVKPENILLESGHAVVADFGIARAITAAGGEQLTATGLAVGTPAYMSPEQVAGDQVLDGRADIYSLACVAYEMLGGAPPFTGPTPQAVMARHAVDPMPSLRTIRPIVSPEVDRVLVRGLAKVPADRFATATQFAEALHQASELTEGPGLAPGAMPGRALWPRRQIWQRIVAGGAIGLVVVAAVIAVRVGFDVGGVRERLQGRSPAPARIKLAVLPFENLTGDPEQEYFSDGLTEEMITQLGRLQPQRLSVIARTSSMRYKNRGTPIDQIGRDLGVDYVLEGSARREGTRVRINATLVQVSDQTQRWSDSFERELAGILSLQSDVARGVAGSLALTLLPAEQARLASARPVNPEAYDDYLKGQVYLWKLTPQALDRAQGYFQLALEKDPNYALAQLGIGSVWAARSNILDLPPQEGWPKTKAAALNVLKVDDTVAEAHNHLGIVLAWYEWDWQAAEREIRRAIEINPNLPDVHRNYGLLLASTARREQAMVEIRRALELDPQSPLWQLNYGLLLLSLGHDDDALAVWQKLLKTDPDFTLTHSQLWNAFHKKGMYAQALAEARIFHTGRGDDEAAESLARGYAEGGYQRAMHVAAEMMAARFTRRYVHPTAVARLYVYAGEKDRALEWLERAYAGRDSQLIPDPAIGV